MASRTTPVIEKSKNHFVIVKKRKSRIVMKDAEKILQLANDIRKKTPKAKIDLLVEGPVCSKSIAFLLEHNIQVVQE